MSSTRSRKDSAHRQKAMTDKEFEWQAEKWKKNCEFRKQILVCGTVIACIFIVCYFGVYLPIEASAGKQTSVLYAMKFISDVKLHVWAAWGAGAVGAGYGITERRKRLSERKERDERIKSLEIQIDGKRSSSGLSVNGEIPKKEKASE